MKYNGSFYWMFASTMKKGHWGEVRQGLCQGSDEEKQGLPPSVGGAGR